MLFLGGGGVPHPFNRRANILFYYLSVLQHIFLCSVLLLVVCSPSGHLVEASRILGKRGDHRGWHSPLAPRAKHRDKIHHDYRLRTPRLNLIPNGVSGGSRGVLSLHPCPPLLPCIKSVCPKRAWDAFDYRSSVRQGTGVPSTRGGETGPGWPPPLPLISRADHSSWTLALLTCILLHHH